MKPKVFIIIINFNGQADTRECLTSLAKLDYPDFEVVVVDNASREKFSLVGLDLDLKIKLIQNSENLGFSGGNNLGIKYALQNNADYILLLNNDTAISPDFLTKLVEAGETSQKFGILGSKIYFYHQPDKLWFAGGRINWLYTRGWMRGYGEIDRGQYDQPAVQPTDYITGCCLLIKKEAIDRVGLMPEEYFLYYEDTDWSLAIQGAGYQCVFVPSAKIWHKGSKSTGQESDPYIYYHLRNGLILAKKYAPWYLKPLVHLDVFWRIAKQVVKLVFYPAKRNWVKYILFGIKDFYLKKWGKNENWY